LPIPADYYTPLLTRTDKLLAIAENGFSSQAIGEIKVTPEDQVAYLNALHSQLGPRLVFWVNMLFNDLNIDSYAQHMKSRMLYLSARLLIRVFAILMVLPNLRWRCGMGFAQSESI